MVSPLSPLVAPSILAGDHAALADSAAFAERTTGVSWLHLDIMDGHFVPNLTFGPKTVEALRKRCKLFFDVHLMLARPDLFIDAFAEAGAEQITVHTEPDYDLAATLAAIRGHGCRVGLAVNPDTPAEELLPYLDQLDIALLMTVQPGFGGQAFRNDVLPKIQWLSHLRAERGLTFRIEVDGGVDRQSGPQCRERGADVFVTGSAFFRDEDPAGFVRALAG